ncbi:MAG: TonB-dependent receptor [Spirosomataceae bacterium]
MKKSTFLILLFLYFRIAAQNPAEVIIKNEFYDKKPLIEVLKDLQKKYGLRAVIEDDKLNNYRISHLFLNVKLSDGLNELIRRHPSLSMYVDELNVFHISAKNADSPLPKKAITQPLKEADEPYRGQPSRTNFTVSGRIVDGTSGESLPFAGISVWGGKINTHSNVDGFFTLLKVPADTVTLLINYVGYQSLRYHLSPKIPTQNLTIEVAPEAKLLDEVTVKGEKTEVVQAGEAIGMIKMNPRNLTKLPNVGERDPFRAFQLMPGVSASNESSSGLYVRGGTPDQTLVLYDGFTVYHVDHLFGFFSAFNYNAIKDIQLFKGGFDAKYGGRISAVAEITGKEGNKKQFNAGADVSLLSANAFVESPLGKKMTVLVAGRRSWKSPLYQKIFDKFTAERQTGTQNQQNPFGGGGRRGLGGGGQANSNLLNQTAASYFYDLNAKLTWNPTTKDILTLSLYNGTDDMDNSTSGSFGFGRQNANVTSTTNDISAWGNLGGSFKWARRWNDKFYLNSLVSYSNYYSRRDNSNSVSFVDPSGSTRSQNLGAVETNDLKDLTVKADAEYKLTPVHRLEFGGQFTQNLIRYDYVQNDTISILARKDQGSTSTVYLQDHITLLNNALTLKPGLRVNYFDVTKKVYLEPRVTASYALNSRIKFKAAFGRYYQFAKQINREDLTQGNRNYWLLADGNNLPVTQSTHYIAGGTYENRGFLFDVEFYQKNNTGITEYTLRFVPQIRRGLTPQETFFNGNEVVKGVDVLIQKKFGALTGWIGYTLAEAVRTVSVFSDKPYYSDQDVRHQFKLAAMYRWKKLDLALTQIYSTGRPYTSIEGSYQLTLLDGSTRFFTMPSDKNANRFPDYHRMDFSATYNLKWGSIGVSVFNVYNRSNIWYKRFQVIRDNNESVLQTTNVTYLGITPNLIISWKLH